MAKSLILLLAGLFATLSTSSSVDSCPGYTVTDITQTATTLTASLQLAGTACNAYGDDVSDLKLLVEYQTGA
jgi:alpha-glucosidase